MHVSREMELFVKHVFHMINDGHIHTGIISKEIQLNIILKNSLSLSLSYLTRLSFKKFENEYVNLALLAPHINQIEM